jgi:hypothetical protein
MSWWIGREGAPTLDEIAPPGLARNTQRNQAGNRRQWLRNRKDLTSESRGRFW